MHRGKDVLKHDNPPGIARGEQVLPNRTVLTTEKIAVFAAMPSASVATEEVRVNPGVRAEHAGRVLRSFSKRSMNSRRTYHKRF